FFRRCLALHVYHRGTSLQKSVRNYMLEEKSCSVPVEGKQFVCLFLVSNIPFTVKKSCLVHGTNEIGVKICKGRLSLFERQFRLASASQHPSDLLSELGS